MTIKLNVTDRVAASKSKPILSQGIRLKLEISRRRCEAVLAQEASHLRPVLAGLHVVALDARVVIEALEAEGVGLRLLAQLVLR